jgi:hypothetical protein
MDEIDIPPERAVLLVAGVDTNFIGQKPSYKGPQDAVPLFQRGPCFANIVLGKLGGF